VLQLRANVDAVLSGVVPSRVYERCADVPEIPRYDILFPHLLSCDFLAAAC